MAIGSLRRHPHAAPRTTGGEEGRPSWGTARRATRAVEAARVAAVAGDRITDVTTPAGPVRRPV